MQRVIDLILAGDIFQANIAQRFTARLSTSFDPLAFYCRCRLHGDKSFFVCAIRGSSRN